MSRALPGLLVGLRVAGVGTLPPAPDGVQEAASRRTYDFAFTPGTGPVAIAEAIPYPDPGDTDTIELTATEPGDHPFGCSFHAALGPVGTMTVSGSA